MGYFRVPPTAHIVFLTFIFSNKEAAEHADIWRPAHFQHSNLTRFFLIVTVDWAITRFLKLPEELSHLSFIMMPKELNQPSAASGQSLSTLFLAGMWYLPVVLTLGFWDAVIAGVKDQRAIISFFHKVQQGNVSTLPHHQAILHLLKPGSWPALEKIAVK